MQLVFNSALIVTFILGAGCASNPNLGGPVYEDKTIDKIVLPPKKTAPLPQPPDKEEMLVDYLGLHRALGLERGTDELGYVEKFFDTCSVGYGYSSSRDCRKDVFVSIQFQILCRDSEGTISNAIGRDDMRPLSGRSLMWTIQRAKGTMRLNGDGVGHIKTTFRNSQRLQRLKLSVDNDFVYVRAGEVKRLVTPRNWCN